MCYSTGNQFRGVDSKLGIFWVSTLFLWALSVVILIFVCLFDWFVVDINDLHGQKWESLQYNGDLLTNYQRSISQHLLTVHCHWDRLVFSGLIIANSKITLIAGPIEGPHFVEDIPVDSSGTCGDLQIGDCRFFFGEPGPTSLPGQLGTNGLPGGFRGIFEGQSWYKSDDESFDFELEKPAGKGALACSIIAAIVESAIVFYFSNLIWCPITPGRKYFPEKCRKQSYKFIQKHVWTNLLCVACMTGLFICVIPFNRGNICGQQGSNGVHIALICMIFFHIACSVCLTAFVVKQFPQPQQPTDSNEEEKEEKEEPNKTTAVQRKINYAIN